MLGLDSVNKANTRLFVYHYLRGETHNNMSFVRHNYRNHLTLPGPDDEI